MRSVSLCLLLIVSLVIFGGAAKNTATVPETDNAPVAQTVTLEVDGIKCGSCTTAIQTQLASVDGVDEATLTDSTATVVGTANSADLIKAVGSAKSCCPAEFSAEVVSK